MSLDQLSLQLTITDTQILNLTKKERKKEEGGGGKERGRMGEREGMKEREETILRSTLLRLCRHDLPLTDIINPSQ